MKYVALALVTVAALGAQPAAHHDPRPTYDERATATIDGSLVRLTLRNPHSFLQVAVRTPRGGEVSYNLEWTGIDDLRKQGISPATFMSGDRVIITGHPSRGSADRRLRVTMLRRPKDGLVWAQPMAY